jgi:predicted transcriptional regulator
MQTCVLLSIKPEFADKIFSGVKRFEFRRVLFRAPSVSRVIVYASHPVKKVVGEFQVEAILSEHKREIWKATRLFAGIKKEYFDLYFRDTEEAHAIKIKNAQRYPCSVPLYAVCRTKRPPQSFMYLNREWSIDSHLGAVLMRAIQNADC